MAGSFTPRSGAIIEGINVTPLVDIMMVLLVIFIVTAKILVTPAIPLDLPQATKSEEIQMIFSVSVPAEGATVVNGSPVADEAALLALARDGRRPGHRPAGGGPGRLERPPRAGHPHPRHPSPRRPRQGGLRHPGGRRDRSVKRRTRARLLADRRPAQPGA